MKTALTAAVLLAVAAVATARAAESDGWLTVRVPGFWEDQNAKARGYDGFAWYRCFVKVPKAFAGEAARLELGHVDDCDEAFVNGRKVGSTGRMPPQYAGLSAAPRQYNVPAAALRAGDWNLIAVRVYDAGGGGGIVGDPIRLISPRGEIRLEGTWQLRIGDDAAWAAWPADPSSAEAKTVAEQFAKIPGAAGGEAALRAALTGEAPPPDGGLVLWYRQPAKE
ncbi:MAG: hypothetical protein IMZ66_07305, partial [Planctomycetes bacterium]|nr:hypothetical protein [Planctomycetota bacterium]